MSLSSLLKWSLYATLPPSFLDRTPFLEGASSLPLRDIPAKRQLKPQTKNKLLSYQPPKQKQKKINFLKQQHFNIP